MRPNTRLVLCCCSDPVPHAPPEDLFYRHGAHEVWYNGHDLVMCDGTGEDPKCSDSVDVFNPLDHALYMHLNVLDGEFHGCVIKV